MQEYWILVFDLRGCNIVRVYFDASIGRCIESYVRLNVFWSVNDASMQID